ncbi:MAG: Uma2 family endonuclease [Synechococcales bacterium]|nr:Uma2 family endonuclease [Synechococcales bacterium]
MVTTPARPSPSSSSRGVPSPQLGNRQRPKPIISWEKPPADFQLDDAPVDNTDQPLLAGALRESLEITGRIQPENLIATNFGLCTKINGELTVKAPDWLYVARVNHPGLDRRTYTPQTEGDPPSIVMEFLSATEGGEYSIRLIPPVGKWFFYEEVLQVPNYVIFEPDSGLLEVYRWGSGKYSLEQPDENGHHWFDELQLFLGTWRGEKEGRSGYWLRWWDRDGNLLPWAIEIVDQLAAEKQRAEQEKQRAERLAALLKAQGIDPDAIA